MSVDIIEIENEKCACKGSYLEKFLQPALLITLSHGPAHGFQMIAELEKSNMVSGDSLDPAGMYRTLKRMEAAGLVTSSWDTESASKPRRIYSLSEDGLSCLKVWQNTLTDYRQNISAILDEIEKLVD